MPAGIYVSIYVVWKIEIFLGHLFTLSRTEGFILFMRADLLIFKLAAR